MNKRSKNQFNKMKVQYCISVNAFLTKYCGIHDESILNMNFSSKDLKVLFPYLKNLSYDKVLENPKEVYTGNILLVKDCGGNVVPYFKPKIIMDECITLDIKIEDKEDIVITAINLEKLTDYQLSLLAKRYKELNRITEYRKVCQMIIDRKNKSNIKKYKHKKEKILIKQKEGYYE